MAYQSGYGTKTIRLGLAEFFNSLTNKTLGVMLAFIILFLWINGSYFWGAYWESETALVYILMFALVLSVTYRNRDIWLSKLTLREGAVNFWIGFLMMFAGLIVVNQVLLHGSLGSSTITSSAVYPAIFLTAFFVAPVEETIFRGVLKDYLKNVRLYFLPMAMIITSALFAITHYAVYHGAIMSIWWAFLMGSIFYMMTSFKPSKKNGPLGVPGAIGAHVCYNLFVLGILSGGIV